MSNARHTPMSNHTKGRLEFSKDGISYAIYIETPGIGLTKMANTSGLHYDREANARRLVACWNACEGIETDLLERTGGIGAAAMPLIKAERDRDELLAALESAIDWIADDSHSAGYGDGKETIERWRKLVASAKGEQ